MVLEITDYESMHAALAELCLFLAENSASENCVFNGKLVATELVGNVLKHSKATATLHARTDGEFIELLIYSSIPFTPPLNSRCSEVFSENGRGLYLVDSVCERRVCTDDGAIKVILRK